MTLREKRSQIKSRLKERNVSEYEIEPIGAFITNEEMAKRILDYLEKESMSTRTREVINAISRIMAEYDEEYNDNDYSEYDKELEDFEE